MLQHMDWVFSVIFGSFYKPKIALIRVALIKLDWVRSYFLLAVVCLSLIGLAVLCRVAEQLSGAGFSNYIICSPAFLSCLASFCS
jgi:hypothetical protein